MAELIVRRSMPLADLDDQDRVLLGRALHFMASGDIVPEWEFETRIGVSLPEFRALVAAWPAWNDADHQSLECLAINNSLNELLNGVAISEQQCHARLGASEDEVQHLFQKWKQHPGQ